MIDGYFGSTNVFLPGILMHQQCGSLEKVSLGLDGVTWYFANIRDYMGFIRMPNLIRSLLMMLGNSNHFS